MASRETGSEETARRHGLVERLLVDVIGLEWEKVHREASRWDGVISADVEDKLVALLGDPATCPHGNPIPGTRRQADGRPTVPLARCPPGTVTVARIGVPLEGDDEALTLLARARLMPGCVATVVGQADGAMAVATPSGEHLVPGPVAAEVWVSVAR